MLSSLFGVTMLVRLVAGLLVAVFYADRLGVLDLTGRLERMADRQTTPGGGQ